MNRLKNTNVFGNIKHIDEYANSVHYKMDKDIRNFIENQGGIMPEKLPNTKHILKELEKDKK